MQAYSSQNISAYNFQLVSSVHNSCCIVKLFVTVNLEGHLFLTV